VSPAPDPAHEPAPAARSRRLLVTTLLAALAAWLVLALWPRAGGEAAGPAEPPPAEEQAAAAEPAAAPAPEPEPAARPLPACVYGDEPAPRAALDDWAYTLLDTRFRLGADYAPTDLVSLPEALAAAVPDADGALAAAGHELRSVAVPALQALFADAEAAGVRLAVQSAYRSYAYQERTFAYWVEVDGYDVALRTSARPGHSEHQLGTAVDLRSRFGPPAWDLDDWAATPEGAWVAANAWRYGFVMSYPRGAEHESCYAYEPWHYRYVGRELAAAVQGANETPRAVLWRLAEEHREP